MLKDDNPEDYFDTNGDAGSSYGTGSDIQMEDRDQQRVSVLHNT